MKTKLFIFFCFFFTSSLLLSQWTVINSNNNYQDRDECGFVELNGVFYLIGRSCGNANIESYDPATNSWSSLTTPSYISQLDHFQAIVCNNKIYVIGNWADGCWNGTQEQYVLEYTPTTNTWVQKYTIPSNRRRGAAGVAVYNNEIYIVGGNPYGHGNTSAVTWIDKYNPLTNTWTNLPDMPNNRDHFEVQVVGNKLYACGGGIGKSDYLSYHRPQMDVFHLDSLYWTSNISQMPEARSEFNTIVNGDEIYYIGGIHISYSNARNIVQVYDTRTNSWRSEHSMNYDRAGAQMINYNGYIWAGPGHGNSSSNILEKLQIQSSLSINEIENKLKYSVSNKILSFNEVIPQIKIYDLTGSEIWGQKSVKSIDLTQFESGIYLISDGKSSTKIFM